MALFSQSLGQTLARRRVLDHSPRRKISSRICFFRCGASPSSPRYLFQIAQRQLGQEHQHRRGGRMRVADQRDSHIVLARPFRMMRDRATTRSGTPAFANTFSTWLSVRNAFASASLTACGCPSARIAPATRAGPRRASVSFSPTGKMRHARQDHFLGDAPNIGRRGRQQAQPHQVEQEELPHGCERKALRRARMPRQTQPHAFARPSTSLPRDGAENSCGQIQALEHQNHVRFFHLRIFEQSEQCFLAGFVHESLQFVARSRPGALDPCIGFRRHCPLRRRTARPCGQQPRQEKFPPARMVRAEASFFSSASTAASKYFERPCAPPTLAIGTSRSRQPSSLATQAASSASDAAAAERIPRETASPSSANSATRGNVFGKTASGFLVICSPSWSQLRL